MAEKEPFYQQLKVINKIYKPNTAAYLMLILDKHKYWASHPDRFYDLTGRCFTGHYYVSRSTIENEINLKRSSQNTAERELSADGIIKLSSVNGNANWYTVDHMMLREKIDMYAQEEEIPCAFDYPFDESEEYEEWIFDSASDIDKKSTGHYANNEQAALSENDSPPCSFQTATNNKELRIKNNNKVSKPTYISNEIDAIYREQGLDTQNSCIKEKSLTDSPPRAHAPRDEALEIIEEYNNAMDIQFTPGIKEIKNVIRNIEDLRKLRKNFSSELLEKVWNDYGDEYTKTKIENKRISAFIRCGLLDKLKMNHRVLRANQTTEIDCLLDKVFEEYGAVIPGIVEPLGFTYQWGNIEPNDANIHFPPVKQRKMRLDIYNKHIRKLLSEEQKHDMMILEI